MQRIAIVDDSSDISEVLTELVQGLGDYVVEEFNCPLAMIKRHDEVAFDVVFSDYHMPKLDGMELAKTLSKMLYPPKKFILMSGENDNRKIKDDCIHQWLNKPFSIEQLEDCLK